MFVSLQTLFIAELPGNRFCLLPFPVSLVRLVSHSHLLSGNLSVSHRSNVFLLLQRFRFSQICSGFKFLAFRLSNYVSFIHLYFLNIAINPVLIQFIYSRLFYSLVVLPKNKIRSIINSFAYYILNSATFNFFVLLAWVFVTF